MRAEPNARAGVQLLETVDVVAQYRCDEGSAASNLADDSGRGNALTVNGTPAVAGRVYDSTTVQGGRDFDGSTDYFQLSDTGHISELQGEASIALWFSTDTVSGNGVLAEYGGDQGGTNTENIVVQAIRLGSELSMRWQHSSGTVVAATTSGLSLETSTPYFACFTRELDPDNDGQYRVRIDLWDLDEKKTSDALKYSQIVSNNLTITDGTTNARFTVGASYSGGALFNGQMTDVTYARRPLSFEWSREQFARAARDYDYSTLANNPDAYYARARVRILDPDGNWLDISDLEGWDFFKGAEIPFHMDTPVGSAKVHLVREQNRRSNASDAPSLSISPGVSGSVLNTFSASGVLLGSRREVKIEVALIPDRGNSVREPYEWEYVLHWHGYTQNVDPSSPDLTLQVDHKTSVLRDMWLQSAGLYGDDSTPEALEDVMQEIIDDGKPASFTYLGGVTPQIRVATSPGTTLNEFEQEEQPILTATRWLADEIGWDFRARWVDTLQEFVFDLAEPDRSKNSVDRTFDAEEFDRPERFEYGIRDIRNAVNVTARDANGDRIETTETNSTSIGEHGYLWGQINEGTIHRIDTAGEIIALGQAALSDLADPVVWATIPLRGFFPLVEIWDRYTFNGDGRVFSGTFTGSVIGYRHVVKETGMIQTVLEIKGDVPTGGTRKWRQIMAGPGQTPPGMKLVPPTPVAPTYSNGVGHAQISWDVPPNAVIRNLDVYEVYTGSSSGFTTSTGTLRARIKTNDWTFGGITDPLTDLSGDDYAKILVRDVWGNASDLSTAVNINALYSQLKPYVYVTSLVTDSTVSLSAATFTKVTFDNVPEDTGGDWSNANDRFTAPVDGLYTFNPSSRMTAGAAGSNMDVRFDLRNASGTSYLSAFEIPQLSFQRGASTPTYFCTIPLALTAGDEVDLYCYSGSAGTMQDRRLRIVLEVDQS